MPAPEGPRGELRNFLVSFGVLGIVKLLALVFSLQMNLNVEDGSHRE